MSQEEKKLFSPRLLNGIRFILTTALILILLALSFKFAFVMLPLTLGLIFAQCIEPVIRFIMRKFKLKRNWVAVLISLIFFGIIMYLIIIGVGRAVKEIAELIRDIPTLAYSFREWLEALIARFQPQIDSLDPTILSWAQSILNNLMQGLAVGVQSVAGSMAKGAFSLPSAFLFLVVTVISTVLFARDRGKILAFFKRQLPESWIINAIDMRNSLFGVVGGYFKAQGKIMICVFVELLIGFGIIGIEYVFLAALIIAIIDALPVFGAGFALIPMAIFGIFTGDYRMGFGAAILYLCTITLRQLLEPNVLAEEIGLSPLLTLASVYGGYKILGVLGMIAGPVLVILIKTMLEVYMGGRNVVEVLDGEPRKSAVEMKLKKQQAETDKKETGLLSWLGKGKKKTQKRKKELEADTKSSKVSDEKDKK